MYPWNDCFKGNIIMMDTDKGENARGILFSIISLKCQVRYSGNAGGLIINNITKFKTA